MMKASTSSILSLLLWSASATVAIAGVQTSNAMNVPGVKGTMKLFADDGEQSRSFATRSRRRAACESVIVWGVGTMMSVDDYDSMGNHTVAGTNNNKGNDMVAVVVDANPGNMVKTDGAKYAAVVNAVVDQLQNNDDLLLSLSPSVCKFDQSVTKIFIGGHSASGKAAVNSVPLLTFTPSGFIGMDPFDILPSNDPAAEWFASMPTLDWGFTRKTCGVSVSKAARAVYKQTNQTHRVFYKIDNTKRYKRKRLTHCSFTDNGCPVCPANPGSDEVRQSVGASIQAFVQAVITGLYDRAVFAGVVQRPGAGSSTDNVDLNYGGFVLDASVYVNNDLLVPERTTTTTNHNTGDLRRSGATLAMA